MADTDWGASGRTDEYTCKLVDPFTLQAVADVDFDAESSSITEAYYSDNYSSASITLEGDDYVLDGREMLLQISHTAHATDGTSVTESLGTFFVDSMTKTSELQRHSRKLAAYSTLLRVTSDKLVNDFARGKGANVVAAIKAVLTADGGKVRVMDGVDTSRTFGQAVAFDLGTTKSTVASEMAGWIGATINVGQDGYLEIAPYLAPAKKSVAYTFEEGSTCTYVAGVEWDSNRDEVLNRVVMYYSRESKQDDDPYPLTDRVCVDLPESSRWSYSKVGRHKTEVVSLSDPCSHTDLLAKAQTYLAENSAEILYLTIQHVQIPGLHAGDVVIYHNSVDEDGLNVKALITQMEISSLNPGGVCTSKLKIIGWLDE